jgi:hypothetical protein
VTINWCSQCCSGFGSYSPCKCEVGDLPDTITITVEGEGEGRKSSIPLGFSRCGSSSYGVRPASSAIGYAESPGGGVLDRGPISRVRLVSGGSGYAVPQRLAPTLFASSASDASFSANLSSRTNACGLSEWYVSSVSVLDAGSNSYDGQPLTLTKQAGDFGGGATACVRVDSNIVLTGEIPGRPDTPLTITAQPASSAGPCNETIWTVTSISFSGSTSGHSYGQLLDIGGPGAGGALARAFVRTQTRAPINMAFHETDGNGNGATFSVSYARYPFGYDEFGYVPGHGEHTEDYWAATGVTVTSPGAGYQGGDRILFSPIEGVSSGGGFSVEVTSVNASGGVVAAAISFPGRNFSDTGVLLGFTMRSSEAGAYRAVGPASRVVVTNGGFYFREDLTLPPVAGVSVSPLESGVVTQNSVRYPNGARRASISATVDVDVTSPTFGSIMSLGLVDGGEGYGGGTFYSSGCCSPGGSYTLTAYRTHDCSFVGFRCWRPDLGGAPAFLGGLLTGRISSYLGSDYFGVSAPTGVPGVVTWPIDKDVGGPFSDKRFALPGRAAVIPYKIWPGDANVSCEVAQGIYHDILPYWYITSASVTPGATGYTNGQVVYLYDPWTAIFSGEQPPSHGDGSGISPTSPILRPELWRFSSSPTREYPIGRAVVADDGTLQGIEIINQGVMYVAVHSDIVPAIVPPITTEILQSPPSTGSGAVVTASVQSDTKLPNFGRVTLAVQNRGGGYIGNAQAAARVQVNYYGKNTRPVLTLDYPGNRDGGPSGNIRTCATIPATSTISNCNDFSFEAEFAGIKATIEPGGSVTPIYQARRSCCGLCDTACKEANITQAVVTITREASEGEAYPGEVLTCPEYEAEYIWDFFEAGEGTSCAAPPYTASPSSIAGFGVLRETDGAIVTLRLSSRGVAGGGSVVVRRVAGITLLGGLSVVNNFQDFTTVYSQPQSRECGASIDDWPEEEIEGGVKIATGEKYQAPLQQRTRICKDIEVEVSFQ